MRQFIFVAILGCLMVILAATPLTGQSFVLNGSASSLGGDCYQLTPDSPGQAGSIFSQNSIDLTQPFFTQATFFFGCKDGNGADGIVFILSPSNTSLGNGGGGLGYEGVTPSIAIEMDDYFNGNYSDPASDHMAVISMGSVNHGASTNLGGPMDISNIEDCMDHCFAVSWDPVSQRLEVVLDDNSITYSGNIVANIFGGNPIVYYGFSSGTGSLSNLHTVCFGPPEVEQMMDETICEGEDAQLQADENGIGWTWAPDPTLSSLTISNPVATPVVTTTYTTIIEYACGYFDYDTVIVNVLPPPDVSATNNSPVCIGEAVTLMATGGTSYEWEGPMNFFSFSQNPVLNNVTIGVAGTYYVTVTDASGCSAVAETEVEIDPGPDVSIDPIQNPICENLDPVQLTADPPGGTWSGGEVTVDGMFDPGYAGEGIHVVTYTATNANGCSNSAEISLEVVPIPEILIDPPGILCENADPIQMTGSPPGGIWEGDISIGGIFDPGDAGDGPHLITYTAEDGNGCSNSADIVIEVVPGLTADIEPTGPFCTTDSVIYLIAIPPGGEWGGDANSVGAIFPADLGAGFYEATYMLNNQQGCYYGHEDIEIVSPPQVNINPVSSLCLDQSPVTLTANPPGGVWSGEADAMGQVDPSALGSGAHQVIYTYANTAGCMGADTFDVVVFPSPPVISNLITTCDPTSTTYTVTFSISGGDPVTYNVQGSSAGYFIPGNPVIFVSDPIPNGDPFTLWVEDFNLCGADTVTGTKLCNCGTNAGTMNLNLIAACEDETIHVLPPSGVGLDPDDSLIYVLHLGFPDSIILVSDSLIFSLGSPLMPGVTYFVSSVAGNASGGIGVDLNDPCLSVSFGTPVMWVAAPTGFISGTSSVCRGDSAALSFMLSGIGPFDLNYTDGTATYFVNAVLSGHTIMVSPQETTTYTLLEVDETTTPMCIGFPDASYTIEVLDNYLIPLSAKICEGDSLYLGGAYQTAGGMYTDSLQTVYGCDSILVTTLTLFTLDTIYLTGTSCDSAKTGIAIDITTDRNGCDSTTITTTTWVLADTTLLQALTCDEQAAGVFTDVYTGQSGCDSVVIETVTFVPPDSTWLSGVTCDPAEAGTFITVRMNDFGCDSFIIQTVNLLPADTTILSGETCDAAASGVFTRLLTNDAGCDSLVIETVTLLPSDTTFDYQLTCLPQETGTTQVIFTNSLGCDSLHFIITSLAPEDSCYVPEIHREIFIPNVFSPNGDGINDYFFISSHPDAISNLPLLRIYDRWGGLVFEQIDILPNHPELGWDGMEKGDPINPGVFVWVAEVVYTDGKTETLTGDVTLMR